MGLSENQTNNINAIEEACKALEEADGTDALQGTQMAQVAIIKAYCTALNAETTDVSKEAPLAKGYARFFNGVLAFTGAIMGALFIGYPNTKGSKIAYQYWGGENANEGPAAAFVNTAVVYEEILGRLALLAVIATLGAGWNQYTYTKVDRSNGPFIVSSAAVVILGAWAALPLIETMFIGRPDQ